MSEQRCPRCESKRPSSRNLVVYSSDLIMEPCRDEWHDLAAQLAEKDAELRALRAANERLRVLAKEATNGWACWATLKREHAEIARLHTAIDAALAASPPHPETEGQ